MRNPAMMYSVSRAWVWLVTGLVLMGGLILPASPVRAEEEKSNSIVAVGLAPESEPTTVVIRTDRPVGYRYTVYDSYDPVRVVVDFPGMSVPSSLPAVYPGSGPVQEIRLSSFDLTSGALGRVELLLHTAVKYATALDGTELRLTFAEGSAPAKAPAAPVEKAPEAIPAPVAKATAAETAPPVPTGPARSVIDLNIDPGRMVIATDGKLERLQYFRLNSPPRLVVDLYGVKPRFKERVFPTANGFRQVRVGTYEDKTRFAYDAEAGSLPEYSVGEEGPAVVVAWGGQVQSQPATTNPHPAGNPMPAAMEKGSVTVESIDFNVRGGVSELVVNLSRAGSVIEPTAKGDMVGFGVKNASISRALRRTIDASAFPSAVRRVTPYTVLMGDTQDVRFAVELKGPASYQLDRSGTMLVLKVDNGAFAEPAPASPETVAVPVSSAAPAAAAAPARTPMVAVPASAADPSSAMAAQSGVSAEAAPVAVAARTSPLAIGAAEGPIYTGQKISLVFDDADIRNILQLVAEVSDLNLIASDDVKGNITLRLVEVPWDQALDLIMEIKGLGMIREGNVARILPKEKIRAMEEAKLTAARTKEKLEDLATEVISVSYTGLGNVAGPAKELLTERGKLTQDNRNKQIIVTDVPSVIEKVKQLISILDTPERQVLIDARIVEVNTNFARDLGINWGVLYQNPGSQLNNASVGIGGDFLIGLPAAGGVGTEAGLGSGITFGQLGIDKTVLNLRLSALETNGQAKVISNPRITTLNGEEAEISQGTTIPYQTVSQDGTKTEFVDAVLNLTVTPVINPDNSVILTIEATNDSPSLTAGAVAPSIDTKKAKTKVLVKDGETTVIGGIFIENDSDSDSGVPFVNKLPWLGNLFKSQRKANSRAELMIFVTPRILN